MAAAAPLTLGLAVRDMKGITKRNLLRIIRTPQLLFMTLVQPTIILLLFRYVLGGAIHVPGVDYVDYVVPGIFLEAVLIGGMTTALALATDLQAGMIDRFRSLPMARSAFLVGRTLADLCRAVLALAFIICLGLLVGFRFHNSLGACLAGTALIIGFGYAFTWVYAAIGLAVKDPQTAQMTSILPMFILFFASSALGSRIDDARLATAVRSEPTGVRHHQLRPGSVRRRTRVPRLVAGGPVVCRDLRGLPGDLIESLSEGDGVIRRARGHMSENTAVAAGHRKVCCLSSSWHCVTEIEQWREKWRHGRPLSVISRGTGRALGRPCSARGCMQCAFLHKPI